MKNIVRVAGLVTEVSLANPKVCSENILQEIKLCHAECDIIVLPGMSICGASSYDLLKNISLKNAVEDNLNSICKFTKDIDSYIIIGLPIYSNNNYSEGYAVLHKGQVISIKSSDDPPTVFAFNNYSFAVIVGDITKQLNNFVTLTSGGCRHIISISALPVVAGFIQSYNEQVAALSQITGCAITVCNGNFGESSSPFLYKPFCGTYLNGEQLNFNSGDNKIALTCDIDLDILSATLKNKVNLNYNNVLECDMLTVTDKELININVSKNPYLVGKQQDYIVELFELQVQSLVQRLRNAKINKCILAVSGGLDSTLALMVAYYAIKKLNLPPSNLIGVTMPCFGTTNRTYTNAVDLINKLNATFKEINIKDSVHQHFKDIGHDESNKNTTYENAQARERTQILLDIGNTENALMVGTGSLSEEALGFSTFAGDHIANYNVNASVTKTIERLIVGYLAQLDEPNGIKNCLKDILNTPVSPELLPPVEGQQQQKTENILGPYIVHDFFLYYFIKYNMEPSKILEYAEIAFKGEYSSQQLLDWLTIFLKRYIGSQFKRSCAPDSAMISEVNLSNAALLVPSDATAETLLNNLKTNR